MGASLFGDTTTVVNANTFTSIAALRGINSLTSTSANVLGYYAAGDGGGGMYYLDAADTTSADNGGTIIVAIDGGRWKLVVHNLVSFQQFGAKGDGVTDDTTFIQKCLAACTSILVAGNHKVTSPLVPRSGTNLVGIGLGLAIINAWGCNLYNLAQNTSYVEVAAITHQSSSNVGVGDPRLYEAISCQGAAGNTINFITARDCSFQGWATSVNWTYTWNSVLINVSTINCNYGVKVIGQSVNNSISDSKLVVNSGIASISGAQSVGVPEGLLVVNTLLSSGQYGIINTGSFLSMDVVNCTLDLISDTAINLTDCKDFHLTNSWVFAANCGFKQNPLGGASSEKSVLVGNRFQITNTVGAHVIEQGGANQGLTAVGNTLVFGGTSVGFYLDGQSAVIDDNVFDNSGTGADVLANSSLTTHRVGKNTKIAGSLLYIGIFGTPEYSEGNWTVTDQSGAGLVITNTSQATYVKNGKQTTIELDVTYPATANASVARLSLPFQPDAGSAWGGSIALQQTVTVALQPNASSAGPTFTFWKPATQTFATNADLTGAHLVVTFNGRASV